MRSSLILWSVVATVGCSTPEAEVHAEGVLESVQSGPEPTSQTTYSCESGRAVHASYPTDSTAVVVYEGETLRMNIAVSGSGARYVSDELEWWTEGAGPGSRGTLFGRESDGTSGERVEECEQPSPIRDESNRDE